MQRLKTLIQRIEELVEQEATIDAIVLEARKLFPDGSRSRALIQPAGDHVYRVTKHHRTIPERIEELQHPPTEKAALNRANRAGNPVFYCSSDPKGGFFELEASAGSYVVLATWLTTLQMIVHELGFTTKVFTRAGAKRQLEEDREQFHNSLTPEERLVRDYVSLAFTERTDHKYRLTAAIAEIYLRGQSISGIIYPAVRLSGEVDNLAILPDFVETGLRLEDAKVVQIREIARDPLQVDGPILCDLEHVESDGTLRWRPHQADGTSVVPPGGRASIPPGYITTTHGRCDIEYRGERYHLEPGYSFTSTIDGLVVHDLQGNIIDPTVT